MFGFFKDKFNNLKETVSNTAQVLVGNVVNFVSEENEFSEFVLDDMEDMLISADLGVNYATELVGKLRNQTKIKPSDVKEYLKTEFLKVLKETGNNRLNYKENELNIYFITGVNGAGKTTLIGKLAYKFKQEGKKVLIAAGDTFRAAAEEQLDIWSKRASAEIIRRDKADPASIVYEAIEKAQKEKFDVIGDNVYYFNKNGYMVTGWNCIDKKWYYFNDLGIMAKDIWIGNYYVDKYGVMTKTK